MSLALIDNSIFAQLFFKKSLEEGEITLFFDTHISKNTGIYSSVLTKYEILGLKHTDTSLPNFTLKQSDLNAVETIEKFVQYYQEIQDKIAQQITIDEIKKKNHELRDRLIKAPVPSYYWKVYVTKHLDMSAKLKIFRENVIHSLSFKYALQQIIKVNEKSQKIPAQGNMTLLLLLINDLLEHKKFDLLESLSLFPINQPIKNTSLKLCKDNLDSEICHRLLVGIFDFEDCTKKRINVFGIEDITKMKERITIYNQFLNNFIRYFEESTTKLGKRISSKYLQFLQPKKGTYFQVDKKNLKVIDKLEIETIT